MTFVEGTGLLLLGLIALLLVRAMLRPWDWPRDHGNRDYERDPPSPDDGPSDPH
jgi:hypothetical protein